jgi:hypothetical protein
MTHSRVFDAVPGLKKLCQAYQSTNCASRVHYMHQLLRLQLQESSNVQEHVSEFLQLFNRLGTLSITFSDEVRASYLLAMLPESWDTFDTAPEAREQALSIDVAVDFLFEEVDCRSTCKASAMAAQSALAAQASQVSSKPFESHGNWAREQAAKGIPPSRPCSTCGEMHWNFQCKSAAPAVAAAPTAVPAAAKVASMLPLLSQLNLGTQGYAWMASSAFKGFSGWYFDSGASHHMTAHSELFTAHQDICPKPISIANGESISAIAAGTARIAVIIGNNSHKCRKGMGRPGV